jgi:hypothetical protein
MSRGIHPEPSILFARGERYGKLMVLARAPTKKKRGPSYFVGCDCGARFVARGSHLRKGLVKACLKCK